MEYTTTEYRTPTAIVTVHRPILTEEERARRMERIRKAAIRVLLSVERNEQPAAEAKNT